MPSDVRPSEGLGVLHLFFHLRPEVLQAPQEAAKDFVARLQAFDAADGQQVHVFSVLGQKADLGVMALAPDLAALDALAKGLAASPLGTALYPAASYVSLTERSEYVSTVEDESDRLRREEVDPGTPEHEEALEAFDERMATYLQHRLYPQLPTRNVIGFYPMSKRRSGDDNWYALDFAERKRLMGGHAAVGKTYRGRVLQLVTTSTGLDDWEWGVTLLADDPKAIRDIVYEMRFDEVSVRYAEFGPFVVGLMQSPTDLVETLGLA